MAENNIYYLKWIRGEIMCLRHFLLQCSSPNAVILVEEGGSTHILAFFYNKSDCEKKLLL